MSASNQEQDRIWLLCNLCEDCYQETLNHYFGPLAMATADLKSYIERFHKFHEDTGDSDDSEQMAQMQGDDAA